MATVREKVIDILQKVLSTPDAGDVHVPALLRVVRPETKEEFEKLTSEDKVGLYYELLESNEADTELAEWTTAYINKLPDSAFAVIESGGKKDDEDKTTPRSLRHLPHHDAEGNIDRAHLQNALARMNQMKDGSQAMASRHLQAHAKSENMGKAAVEGATGAALAEASYEQRTERIREAVRAKYGQSLTPYGVQECYVEATYEDSVVANVSGKLWRIPYTMSGTTVELGEAEEVVRGYDKALSEFAWGVEMGEGSAIQIARTGKFKHPEYGEFDITKADLQEMARNFKANVRGQDIPIDIDHDHKGGAVGWIRSVQVKDGDALWATPEWTEDGERLVADGRFKYFSPHFGPWEDPESGAKHRLVLMSGAITNFPFLKNMQPIALSEFATYKEDKMAPDEQKPEAQLTELSAALTEAQSQNRALRERVEAMERRDMERYFSEIIRGSGNPNARWYGNEEQHVTMLMALAEKFGQDSAEVKHYVALNQTHAEQLRRHPAFQEVGSSAPGGAPATVAEEVEQELRRLIENEKVDRPAAIVLLAERFPILYKRYDDEQKARAFRAQAGGS